MPHGPWGAKPPPPMWPHPVASRACRWWPVANTNTRQQKLLRFTTFSPHFHHISSRPEHLDAFSIWSIYVILCPFAPFWYLCWYFADTLLIFILVVSQPGSVNCRWSFVEVVIWRLAGAQPLTHLGARQQANVLNQIPSYLPYGMMHLFI